MLKVLYDYQLEKCITERVLYHLVECYVFLHDVGYIGIHTHSYTSND